MKGVSSGNVTQSDANNDNTNGGDGDTKEIGGRRGWWRLVGGSLVSGSSRRGTRTGSSITKTGDSQVRSEVMQPYSLDVDLEAGKDADNEKVPGVVTATERES